MSFKRLSRPAAAGLGSLVVACAAAGIVTASTAHAAGLGAMEVSPAKGSDTSGVSLTTPGPCPSAATNLIVSVAGSGFPAGGQNVVSNSPITTYAATPGGGIVVPLTQTMRDYASTAGFTTLKGRYDFTLTCRGAFGSTTYGDFTAPVWFTSNTAYQDTDPSGPTTKPPTTPPTSKPPTTKPPTTPPTSKPPTTKPPTTPPTSTPPTSTPPATPTGTPSSTDTPTPTGTASPTDTSATSGGSTTSGGSQGVSTIVTGGGSGGGNGSLAATGTDAAVLGGTAAVLVLAGGAAVWRSRRRTHTVAHTPND